jgi:C-terminal processing protease CtpA/Prc
MLKYNNKWQSENYSMSFLPLSNSLNLSRMVVITSRLTASASEAVMNGLAPHINVVSVGDTTNGKPMGMNGWACGQKYLFYPITFKLVNSLGEGEYFDGISPDKTCTDDVTHDFSDRDEACLTEAISYLKTGSFTGKGPGSFTSVRQFSEKPVWMNNMFTREEQIIEGFK